MGLPALPSFGGSSASPAVRRPVFSVQFSAGSGGGGLGGALGLGGGGGDPWQESVAAISVSLGLAPAVDVAEIYLAAGQRAPVVAVGDTGSIGFGYDGDSPTTVFTGRVEAVRHDVRGLTRVTAGDGGAALSHLRLDQSYEQQAAGDIVSDLAGRVEIDTDRIESGSRFPFYVVDAGRHAYQHIAALALKCGLLAHFTAEGKLVFAAAAGAATQTFTYGVDVLALEVSAGTPAIGKATVVGEGAAGGQGQAAWSWLIKDPSSVTAAEGQGLPELAVADRSLRSADAAQAAARALAAVGEGSKTGGRLLTSGAPSVTVGGTIVITGAPQDALNGEFQVRTVQHRYSKAGGYTTLLHFSA